MKTPILILYVFLGCILLPVYGQNNVITRDLGNYRFDLDIMAGTFQITYSTPEESVILIDSGTPYGSMFRIIENNRPIQFSQALISITQDTSFEGIALEYSFIDNSKLRLWFQQAQPNEFRLTYRFLNQGLEQKYIQILLDTVLGEIGGNHFFYNDIPITREFGFTLQGEAIATSPIISGVSREPGLFIQPVSPATNSQPVQIALGNTRRLTETFGFFTVNSNRNFNLLPFSVNDSAVLLTQSIDSQDSGSMIIRFQFGSDFSLRGSASLPSTEFRDIILLQDFNRSIAQSDTQNSSSNQNNFAEIQSTLSVETGEILNERLTTINQLNRLLLQIDQALSNPNQQIDVEFLEAEIERIRRSSGL